MGPSAAEHRTLTSPKVPEEVEDALREFQGIPVETPMQFARQLIVHAARESKIDQELLSAIRQPALGFWSISLSSTRWHPRPGSASAG